MKFVGALRSQWGNYTALVEVDRQEFQSITGRDINIGQAVAGEKFDVQAMWYALRNIATKSQDMKRMWASMQAFLDLTEDQAILAVMEKCGVAEKVVEQKNEEEDDCVNE